jgi:hypothetical protein
MIPEELLYNQLLNYFPAQQLAPGGEAVYHGAPGLNPVDAYVVYTKTDSNIEYDMSGNVQCQKIEIDVNVASMFYPETVAEVLPHYWTDTTTGSTWYFTLTNQTQSSEAYEQVFTFLCVN